MDAEFEEEGKVLGEVFALSTTLSIARRGGRIGRPTEVLPFSVCYFLHDGYVQRDFVFSGSFRISRPFINPHRPIFTHHSSLHL
jgi:hypothetical protein